MLDLSVPDDGLGAVAVCRVGDWGVGMGYTGIMIDHRRIVMMARPHLHLEGVPDRGSPAVFQQMTDDLTIVCGAIVDAIQRDLTPDKMITDQSVRSAVARHSNLVRRQGLSASILVDQYAVLRQAMLLSLEVQSRQVKISGDDAFLLAQRLCALFDRVVMLAIEGSDASCDPRSG